jgi:hypothetical protein
MNTGNCRAAVLRVKSIRLAFDVACLAVTLGIAGRAQVTERVSVASNGTPGNAASGTGGISVSADGRYVAFSSYATNLVPGDTNGFSDIFVRDRQAGTTERVSVDSGGGQSNGDSFYPSISSDGRYVAFHSSANNLVFSDANNASDIFVHDRQIGTTELVSVDSNELQGNGGSLYPSISADGRYVAFQSSATNLVPGDTNMSVDVFVRDRQNGTTERVSVDSTAAQANASSYAPSISADGNFVAFHSLATNLVTIDTNLSSDVFVRDRSGGTTSLVSLDSSGIQANGNSYYPSISSDGRFVAFWSSASNLVPGDTNGVVDVFVRDRQTGTTQRVSVDSNGLQANGGSYYPSISSDGRYVAFWSIATNLVVADTNGVSDVFLRDRQVGTTERDSVTSAGVQGNDDSYSPAISADGRYVAFYSVATNLVPGDTNGVGDVFVRDRLGGAAFTSLCSPGLGGVIACACSNPPAAAGQGCDNSAGTGGAILFAHGDTSLSSDSLVFTTTGEKLTATSIVLQGDALAAAGLVFGQGVRCVDGTLKRLYTKSAAGGSITAPNFAAGDATVSARSAALGDVILAGQSRWYLVYYRDPIVLGGCPIDDTFNATQTGQVVWSP